MLSRVTSFQEGTVRNDRFIAAAIVLFFVITPAYARYNIAPGFAQSNSTPASFQGTDALTVAVDGTGNLRASNGSNISTFYFDGRSSTSIPFTQPLQFITRMRYDAAGKLDVLTANSAIGGSLLSMSSTGVFTHLQDFDST